MNAMSEVMVDTRALDSASRAVAFSRQSLPEDAIRMLASEVIVRLSGQFIQSPKPKSHHPSEAQIDAFATALISGEPDAGLEMIKSLRDKGVSRNTLYLDYVAMAARCLGERWERDEVPFTDVSIAASRLYVIMRALRPAFVPQIVDPASKRSALFISTPGEDHTLGVTMAADMFRDNGWMIDLKVGLEHDALVHAVEDRFYPFIGISASTTRGIVPLTRLIASIRLVSPASCVMVSGEIATIEPDLDDMIDVDGIAGTLPDALSELERMLEEYY